MAEGKKLAIHKHGRAVELRTVEKPLGLLPMMAYTERPHTPSLQASSPIWRAKRTVREHASERRTREGPTTTFHDIPQMESLVASQATPEGGTFFQVSGILKGRDFTRWSIWKGGEICHLGLWKGPKGRTDECYGFIKSRKRSFLWFPLKRQCIYSSYKRCNVLNKVRERAIIRQQKVYERGTFFVKMVYKRVSGWTRINICWVATPPPPTPWARHNSR